MQTNELKVEDLPTNWWISLKAKRKFVELKKPDETIAQFIDDAISAEIVRREQRSSQ